MLILLKVVLVQAKGRLVQPDRLSVRKPLYSFSKRIFMKKKNAKTLSLKKHTIANLQAVTGGLGQGRDLGFSKVSEGCPPVTEGCNNTQHGGTCQRTIA